jgi:hypothetical protein
VKSTVSSEDVSEIRQVAALAMHVVDKAEWSRLNEVFTQDATFDGRKTPTGVLLQGLASIEAEWPTRRMGLHFTTDFVVTEAGSDGASASSIAKYMTTLDSDHFATGLFEDRWRKTADGWRIASRTPVPLVAPDAPFRAAK